MKSIQSFYRRATTLALFTAGIGAQEVTPTLHETDLGLHSTLTDPHALDWRDEDERSAPDYLFPRRGRSIATFATGIPFVAIAEVAYGVTDRFSVGVLGGIVPHNPGYGLRLRYLLAQPSENFRVHFKMPVIYYPKAKSLGCPECEPWFLAWPAVSAEWRRASGTRWWVGAGAVAAACADTVFRRGGEAMETGGGIQEGTWTTLQFGFNKPLTRKLAFQCEVAPVLKGYRLATHGTWLGGPPVILTTGLSYSF